MRKRTARQLKVYICSHTGGHAKRGCYSRGYRYDELKYQLPSRFCICCTHNFKRFKGLIKKRSEERGERSEERGERNVWREEGRR